MVKLTVRVDLVLSYGILGELTGLELRFRTAPEQEIPPELGQEDGQDLEKIKP